jgi:hypothetical protein
VEVDAAKFAFEMEKAKAVTEAPESLANPEAGKQYSGKLDWVEPFATAKAQTLHFEIQTWSDPKTERNYLFVCTSPKPPVEAEPVWKELRGIRRGFTTGGMSKK